MNGIHDMGGMHGFGPVVVERDEPVFHAPWERAVFASTIGTMAQGLYNLDEFRHAIERMGNAHYMQGSYYEHWLASIETLLVDKGIVSAAELDARTAEVKQNGTPSAASEIGSDGEDPLSNAFTAGLKLGASTLRSIESSPKFSVGDAVVAKVMSPRGHTRLPRYVCGKPGIIEIAHGAFVFPDANAHLRGENPEYVYAVKFESRDVWGEAAGPGDALYVDLWESYLEDKK